jgi:hypothetical protein
MAMIQNHFEINVSLNGQHLFATADRSCVGTHELKRVLPLIIKKFPKSEGFEISVQKVECSGRSFTPEQIEKI